MATNVSGASPWYREPLVWMVLAIPAAAVIAGAVMLVLANATWDGLVTDDYYQRGMQINRSLTRDAEAARLGLEATLAFPAPGVVEARLAGMGRRDGGIGQRSTEPSLLPRRARRRRRLDRHDPRRRRYLARGLADAAARQVVRRAGQRAVATGRAGTDTRPGGRDRVARADDGPSGQWFIVNLECTRPPVHPAPLPARSDGCRIGCDWLSPGSGGERRHPDGGIFGVDMRAAPGYCRNQGSWRLIAVVPRSSVPAPPQTRCQDRQLRSKPADRRRAHGR